MEQGGRRRRLRGPRPPGEHDAAQGDRHHQALVDEQHGAAPVHLACLAGAGPQRRRGRRPLVQAPHVHDHGRLLAALTLALATRAGRPEGGRLLPLSQLPTRSPMRTPPTSAGSTTPAWCRAPRRRSIDRPPPSYSRQHLRALLLSGRCGLRLVPAPGTARQAHRRRPRPRRDRGLQLLHPPFQPRPPVHPRLALAGLHVMGTCSRAT